MTVIIRIRYCATCDGFKPCQLVAGSLWACPCGNQFEYDLPGVVGADFREIIKGLV